MISIDTVSYTPNIKIKLGLQHHAQLLTQQSSKQLQDLASQHQLHRTCLANFFWYIRWAGNKDWILKAH